MHPLIVGRQGGGLTQIFENGAKVLCSKGARYSLMPLQGCKTLKEELQRQAS